MFSVVRWAKLKAPVRRAVYLDAVDQNQNLIRLGATNEHGCGRAPGTRLNDIEPGTSRKTSRTVSACWLGISLAVITVADVVTCRGELPCVSKSRTPEEEWLRRVRALAKSSETK